MIADDLRQHADFQNCRAGSSSSWWIAGSCTPQRISVGAWTCFRRVSDAKRYLDSTGVVTAPGVARRGMVAAALDAMGAREQAIAVLRHAVDDHDLWLA